MRNEHRELNGDADYTPEYNTGKIFGVAMGGE